MAQRELCCSRVTLTQPRVMSETSAWPDRNGQSHHKPLQFVVALQGRVRRPRGHSTRNQLGTSTLATQRIRYFSVVDNHIVFASHYVGHFS